MGVLLRFLLFVFCSQASAGILLLHTDYRKCSDFDPGTLRIFFQYDESAGPIKEVHLDGMRIPVSGIVAPKVETTGDDGAFGEQRDFLAERVIWARLFPGPVAPAAIGEIRIKLAHPLKRPAQLKIVPSQGGAVDCMVRRDENPAVTSITVSQSRQQLHAFIHNRTSTPYTVTIAALDGRVLDAEQLSLSLSPVPAAKFAYVTITLPAALPFGSTHHLLLSDGTHSIVERFTVNPLFPIATEGRKPPASYGLDTSAAGRRPRYLQKQEGSHAGKRVREVDPDIRTLHIYDCAMHHFAAKLDLNAKEIFRRTDKCIERDPLMPRSVHLCRIRPEEGYAKFAETTDILRINPNITNGVSSVGRQDSPAQTAARLTRFAVEAAAPGPVHSVLQSSRLDNAKAQYTPSEFRKLAYAIVGEGVKGLLYRHRWQTTREDPLQKSIQQINAELRHLKPLMITAAPYPGAQSDDRAVSYRTLATPARDVLLFVVNHSGKTGTPLRPTIDFPFACQRVAISKLGSAGFTPQADDANPAAPLELEVPDSAVVYRLQCR